jgi:predicted TIM-barrel fold metal-dependent hydrolase
MIINRRKFFSSTAMSAAGLMLGSKLGGLEFGEDPGHPSFNIMKEVLKYRKLDPHVHAYMNPSETPESLLDIADRLGIEKLFISRPIPQQETTQQEIIESNDLMIKAMKLYPKRFRGQFTLNPRYPKESLEEIKRCVGNGMVGLKVYYQVKINDPLFYPIIEKMIDLKMITLMHANCQLGMAGYRMKYDTKLNPNTSIPEDFVDVAKRYPEAMLQFAHTGGGGDWEYECKCLRDYPNICVDVSGSNNEGNMINYALKYLGEDRLFFASDNSFYQSVSKIIAADLTETQRKKIFFDNYNNLLKKGGYDVA